MADILNNNKSLERLLRRELIKNGRIAIVLSSILLTNILYLLFIIILLVIANWAEGVLAAQISKLIQDKDALETFYTIAQNIAEWIFIIILLLINVVGGIRLLWEVIMLLLKNPEKIKERNQNAQEPKTQELQILSENKDIHPQLNENIHESDKQEYLYSNDSNEHNQHRSNIDD